MRAAGTRKDGRALVSDASYALWDADTVFGCVCGAGWEGYDCSIP